MRTLYRLFGRRDALMRELGFLPEPPAREQILEVAAQMVGRRGWNEFSMDELAADAAVSRATLYRLFPGKSALFNALIEAYSPWESIHLVVDAMPDAHPREMVPALATAVASALQSRIGLLIPMLLEMAKDKPDTLEGMGSALQQGLADVVQYLDRQMGQGTLRRTNPIVAFQLLAGPIVVHMLTRPLAQRAIGLEIPVTSVVDEVAASWLRSMLTDSGGDG